MTPSVLMRFLIGDRDSIRTVIASRSALWTGLFLVLLTSFPRNYDQVHVVEKPALWFLGPLLFSLVSGTWMFLVVYVVGCHRTLDGGTWGVGNYGRAWRGFMGAFWMTAPIAWIYALPVERFLDSLGSTRVNLVLLGVVSTWRVILFSRILEVATGQRFLRSFLWVLLGAAVEVCVVFLLGDTFSRKLMAAMGGLRNSPEEDLMISVVGNVFTVAFFSVPALVVILVFWRLSPPATRWPETGPGRVPWRFLGTALVVWVSLTIPAQRQLYRNVEVERLVSGYEFRDALDYLNRHAPGDFSPSRRLPPKLYEWTIFQEMLPLASALRATDAPWVREHVIQGLDVLKLQLAKRAWISPDQVDRSVVSKNLPGQSVADLQQAASEVPELAAWIRENPEWQPEPAQVAPARLQLDPKPDSTSKGADPSDGDNTDRDRRDRGATDLP